MLAMRTIRLYQRSLLRWHANLWLLSLYLFLSCYCWLFVSLVLLGLSGSSCVFSTRFFPFVFAIPPNTHFSKKSLPSHATLGTDNEFLGICKHEELERLVFDI
jgi:hypothetical protein